MSNYPPGVRASDFDDPHQVEAERFYENLKDRNPDLPDDELWEMAYQAVRDDEERIFDQMFEDYQRRFHDEP